MNNDIKTYLVGLLAGIASAILLLSAGSPSVLSIFLLAAASLPIFIAGLGWSNKASITAAITAAIILFFAVNEKTALASAATTLLPAVYLSHLSTLARPASEVGGPDDALAWYPLSQFMLHACTAMVLATIVIGMIVGYSAELANDVIDEFFQALSVQSPEFQIAPDALASMKASLTLAIPMVQSAMWVLMVFAAWYFAQKIVRLSGQSKRPKDDIALTLRMPTLAAIFMCAGLVLTFFQGPISHIGAVICGSFGMGFMMSGLAKMHYTLRDKNMGGMIIFISYFAIVFLTFPIFIFLIIGLFETNKSVPMLMSKSNNSYH